MPEINFCDAIRQNNVSDVTTVFSKNRQIIYEVVPGNHLGWNAIHLIARFGMDNILFAIIKFAKEQKIAIDFERKDRYGWSATHVAVANGKLSTLQYLLSSGASSVSTTNLNESLAFIAVKFRQPIILSYLKKIKADFSLASTYGMKPIDLANLKNYTESIEAINNNSPAQEDILQNSFSGEAQQTNENDITIAVFEGGGVKGAAFYGAFKVLLDNQILSLEKMKIMAGTSAGAITAMLLSIGYDIESLGHIIGEMQFNILLEENFRDIIFQIKDQLHETNGTEKLLGTTLYKVMNRIKNEGVNFNAVKNVIFSYLLGNIPVINELTQGLGIHENEAAELSAEIADLKDRLMPVLLQITDYHGIFEGEILRRKFAEWMKGQKLKENLTFSELHDLAVNNSKYKDLYVAAYNSNQKMTKIFSYEDTPDAIIIDAVRCSMSIQIFFQPHGYYINNANGKRERKNNDQYFDGGSLNNYLLNYFDVMRFVEASHASPQKKVSNSKAIGFRLLRPELYAHYEEHKPLPNQIDDGLLGFISSILTSALSFSKQESDYRLRLDEQERTVHINTFDISAIDFNLSEASKLQLIEQGRKGALSFIKRFRQSTILDGGNGYSFIIPKDKASRFNYLYALAASDELKAFDHSLSMLGVEIELIVDAQGNTLLHQAIQEGKLTLVEHLFVRYQDLCVHNHQGLTPLDHIVFCRDYSARESILSFFAYNGALDTSSLISSKKPPCQSSIDKCNYLLKLAHDKNILPLFDSYFENDQKRDLQIIESRANTEQVHFIWDGYPSMTLVRYVYVLVKYNRVELIDKLNLFIDQTDENGMTALHYFVLQNDLQGVNGCFEALAYPNVCGANGDSLLDSALKIQSFSSDDTSLQQKGMIGCLLRHHACRCKLENRGNVVQHMNDYGLKDENMIQSFEDFQQFSQAIDFDENYRQFNQERNLIKINRKHSYTKQRDEGNYIHASSIFQQPDTVDASNNIKCKK